MHIIYLQRLSAINKHGKFVIYILFLKLNKYANF